MEELFELRRYIEQHDYIIALTLIGEMDDIIPRMNWSRKSAQNSQKMML